jgi:hypothetical protein
MKMHSLVAMGWVSTQAAPCSACLSLSDVRALPICRFLGYDSGHGDTSDNNLSGPLPKEWRAMTALTYLYVHPDNELYA